MKDRKGLIIGIAVVAVIIIAGIAIMAAGSNKDDSTNNGYSNTMNGSMSNKMSSSETNDTSGAVASDSVNISNYAFGPAAITVKVGTKVTWTNMDAVHHSVAADSPSADFSDGPLFGKGETYSFTFKKAGTYKYHCSPHPYMHGSVVVTE